jgi:hypothetical protein
MVDVKALTAFLAKPGFVFLAGGDGLNIRMIPALHLFSLPARLSTTGLPDFKPFRNRTNPEQNIRRPCPTITFPCA